MSDTDAVIDRIREAFRETPYPGDPFLQGSFEGCEPYEVAEAFEGEDDWEAVDAEKLDAQADALSFFSEGALRFFLPAFLIADLRDELERASPLFYLTMGFHATSVEVPIGGRRFERRGGGTTLLNPRRFGAIRFVDYCRYRLSVFTREEARAIVAYLEARRAADEHGIGTPAIDAALEGFWRERAAGAPPRRELVAHLEHEDEYLAALQEDPLG